MPKKPSSKSPVAKSSKSTAASGKTKSKTAASKSGTKKGPPINKMNDTVKQLKELGENLERAAEKGIYDSADKTQDHLKKIKDIISEATDKGVNTIREVTEKIHHFASEATELTKLKIELHNMQKEREKFLLLMGEQLRNLHKSGKVRNINKKFQYDFQKLDEIEAGIAEKEKEVSKHSLNFD